MVEDRAAHPLRGVTLETRQLAVTFPVPRRVSDRVVGRPALAVHAVDGVDLRLTRGEALGLVGESGCGKSTLAFCLVGLLAPSSGEILLDGKRLEPSRAIADQRRIQIVFQDPYSSLNPRLTVGQCLAELLRVHHLVSRSSVKNRCEELMNLVGLSKSSLDVHPRKMSGGQRQRVAIARALAVDPDVLIADEPVSALDVSVQATILDLLDSLRRELDLAILFISHNMAVVRHLCERVAVMYLGRIIEQGETESLFRDPRHPYTQGLIAAVPRLAGERNRRVAIAGDLPSPINLPTGCRFHPRCSLCAPLCQSIDPPVTSGGVESEESTVPHEVACHFAWSPRPADS